MAVGRTASASCLPWALGCPSAPCLTFLLLCCSSGAMAWQSAAVAGALGPLGPLRASTAMVTRRAARRGLPGSWTGGLGGSSWAKGAGPGAERGRVSCGLGLQLSPPPEAGVATGAWSEGGRLELDRGGVHLWFVETSKVLPEDGKEEGRGGCPMRVRYAEVLSEGERERYEALLAGKRHDQADSFLVARALVRGTLSRYCPEVPPSGWRFLANEHGRPELCLDSAAGEALPGEIRRVRFNLSHCQGLVVCGVTLGRDVGVDAEPIAERRRMMGIAKRFFTEEETDALGGMGGQEQATAFCRLWTLKEAYVKARGLGIAGIGLDKFRFKGLEQLREASFASIDPAALEGGGCKSVEVDMSEAGDEACRWQMISIDPGRSHAAAVAVARDADGSGVAMTAVRTVPLCEGSDEVMVNRVLEVVPWICGGGDVPCAAD